MSVGMICLATHQGLGYLARDFFNAGLIDYVYIQPHSSRTNNWDWYPPESRVPSVEALLEKCDVIFAIETFFNWKVIPQAREKGKKTVLMVMYECSPHPTPYQPDLVLSPSLLDKDYYPESTLVTVPVDLNALKPRIRRKAEVFVHNAGNGGLGGRNGTKELLEALQHVKSPIKLIVRAQSPLKLNPTLAQQIEEDDRVEIRYGTFDDIWSEGDVFVFPEKFNGLSLPIQEAFASGMVVMSSDRHPFNKWLPTEPLIPVKSYRTEQLAIPIQVAELSPVDIANAIDNLYNKDITNLSKLGIMWGQSNSWTKLKEVYATLMSR